MKVLLGVVIGAVVTLGFGYAYVFHCPHFKKNFGGCCVDKCCPVVCKCDCGKCGDKCACCKEKKCSDNCTCVNCCKK